MRFVVLGDEGRQDAKLGVDCPVAVRSACLDKSGDVHRGNHFERPAAEQGSKGASDLLVLVQGLRIAGLAKVDSLLLPFLDGTFDTVSPEFEQGQLVVEGWPKLGR
ncbi:hypothetical protein QTH90_20870 [Variovorax sp. J2P1-59]|uniref:hypothetical protein n=1 Tax=Variovorax flavidus TaxID=3053501 RepID=UPI0025751CC8|nr:hypothetical protein [Variovorax sp. J2P1-59]MDM0076874.1 hypothetical protein [Variovorax sp. J2P1-59]